MRVIAGLAKRCPLVAPKGEDVRPTTDRTKETLFNMIYPEIIGQTVLDLFSGSGAIGIEALSRGAKEVVFIEQSKEALTCIKENLTKTKLKDGAEVLEKDVLHGIEWLHKKCRKFDMIFMDPPYNKGWEERVILKLVENNLLVDDGVLICESSIHTSFDFIDQTGYEIEKEKKFKTNKFTFIKKMDHVGSES